MLFLLTGDVQIGKTRWLERLAAELAGDGVPVAGVLAPGVWRVREPHEVPGERGLAGEGRFEKLGIDNVLLPGGERVDVKEALEGLLDTEHRTVQKHFNVTPYEDTFIRSAAKKAGMTQSRFMVDRILHTPMYYIGDPDFFQKFFYELNKQGVNLNQLTAAANTLVLLQDMPDVSKERRRELIGQIENFVATLKDPYCKALAETRGLMMQLRRQSEVER